MRRHTLPPRFRRHRPKPLTDFVVSFDAARIEHVIAANDMRDDLPPLVVATQITACGADFMHNTAHQLSILAGDIDSEVAAFESLVFCAYRTRIEFSSIPTAIDPQQITSIFQDGFNLCVDAVEEKLNRPIRALFQQRLLQYAQIDHPARAQADKLFSQLYAAVKGASEPIADYGKCDLSERDMRTATLFVNAFSITVPVEAAKAIQGALSHRGFV
ncbi:hypothetical protein B2G71_19385 [Novosphingobium sp. PC22D]|jgi:hypothetical protein|nr:hypothetical protein B2G71_19385 [Novosphingobium sp. PC22D]